MGDRLVRPAIYNHYSYLADSFLNGQLEMVREPPHQNDWAYYDGHWYVSFPPVPALLMAPGVALFGWDADAPSPVPASWQRRGTSQGRYRFNEAIFNLAFAPVPPLLLFLILESLRRRGRSKRSTKENIILTVLFGVGTMYFVAAVQADTWHIAHVVGCTFLGLYLLAALDGRHPLLAALTLGLAFGSRTPMIFAFPFFFYELFRHHGVLEKEGVGAKVRSLFTREILLRSLVFVVILSCLVALWLLMNEVRFGDPFDFGHRHLQVRWLPRIQRWGLFDFHYLSRNLAAALVLTPWVTETPPYFQIGHHGIALWLTTPVYFYLLWPRDSGRPLLKALTICVLAVALPSLLYQNTGWVQFGYRFSNDYAMLLIMLLAVGGRQMTRTFRTFVVLSIVVCAFGAITFNRIPLFYNQDLSQRVFFQPD